MSTLARFAPQLHFVPPSSSAQNALSSSKIGAIQSYSTVYGNALSVRFQSNETISNGSGSSSLVPLANPLALAACEASVLEMWFSELVKPRFGMHKHEYGIPIDAVKQKIGLINTCYHSTSPFLDSRRLVPFAGSAEFSLLPHREELNFSVTLWDELKRPLSTTTWTGPKGKFGGGPVGIQMSNDEVELELKKMKRLPIQEFHQDEKSFGNNERENKSSSTSSYSTSSAVESSSEKFQTLQEQQSQSLFSELFLPEIPRAKATTLKKTKNGGYSILVTNSFENVGQSRLMTIPVHDTCLCEFAAQVWNKVVVPLVAEETMNKQHEELENDHHSLRFCRMVSKTATVGSVNVCEPFELRSSPPIFNAKLFTKPWEHKTGLPNLRGEACLGLRIETIQGDEVRGVGTYYFTRGF